jgi:O-antigen ligase
VLIILIVFSANKVNFNEKFEKWIFYSALALILVSYLEFFDVFGLRPAIYKLYSSNSDKYSFSTPYRNIGTAGNPNDFSVICLVFILYYLNKLINDINKGSTSFLILILLTPCLFMTGSRTAFVALIVSSIFSIFVNAKSDFIVKFGFLLSMAVLFTYVYSSNIAYLTDGIASYIQGDNTSMLARYLIWDNAIMLINGSPYFGYGTAKDFISMNTFLTDNEYLMILFRSGFIGFIIFFITYLKSFLLFKGVHFPPDRIFMKYLVYSLYVISLIYMYTSNWYFSYKSFLLFVFIYSISLKFYSQTMKHQRKMSDAQY